MSLGTRAVSQGRASSVNRLAAVFHPLSSRLFSTNSEFVTGLETKLGQARMTDTVELYLARAVAVGFGTGFALWLVGTVIGYALFATGLVQVGELVELSIQSETLLVIVEMLETPVLVAGTGVLCGTVGVAVGFASVISIPYSRASARKREITLLLPDAVSFMYALSVGGLDQLEILEAMADADDAYGDVALEFRSIVRETEYFDVDYRTAIRKRAHETPSDDLSQFLTDMLSIVNSGGDVERFLEEKKDNHMRTAKQRQERTLDTLELFGEMYMTLSLFPLLLVIVMVVMQLVPDAAVTNRLLYLTVYGLIPLISIGFLVLVSTVKHDEPGNGFLEEDSDTRRSENEERRRFLDLGLVEQFTGETRLFSRIETRERAHEARKLLERPHVFFREYPLVTLALTIPTSFVVVAGTMVTGIAPLSWSESIDEPVRGTIIYLYLPLFIVLTPLAIFHEWNVYYRNAVVGTLSEDLRKLSSANDTGLTLLGSLRSVSQTTNGTLASEFEVMHTKVSYGWSLNGALTEFNNTYRIPRLARTTRLITEAQKATNHITPVLRTAAKASENRDDLERQRRSRTRMQVAIIVMTFLTVLTVIAVLQTQFIETMSNLDTGSGTDAGGGAVSGQMGTADPGSNIDADMLSMVFFHAVTLQAILSGLICGYLRNADLLSGLKYVIALSTTALLGWLLVV